MLSQNERYALNRPQSVLWIRQASGMPTQFYGSSHVRVSTTKCILRAALARNDAHHGSSCIKDKLALQRSFVCAPRVPAHTASNLRTCQHQPDSATEPLDLVSHDQSRFFSFVLFRQSDSKTGILSLIYLLLVTSNHF